jgi:hypothetical protein
MKKKEFKVGDRVAFDVHWFGTTDRSGGMAVQAFLESNQECKTFRGKITAIKGDTAQILTDAGGHRVAPIKNLRRLKAPAKPRRIWVSHTGLKLIAEYSELGIAVTVWPNDPCTQETVEFVEVKKP